MQTQYCSCRNRHCPKCQSAAARQWLADREAELLPVPYHHIVFTLPAAIAKIAWAQQGDGLRSVVQGFGRDAADIAADPKHLGARIGITAVLHTWGSAMTHHPHIHMIVPGGGISLDGRRWISRRPDFFLPVRVLSALFRRLMLQKLAAAHAEGQLAFYGADARLAERRGFMAHISPLRHRKWFVYSKPPFAGPEAVLAYLARYTHRVAISNRRLIRADAQTVTFKVKDYRVEGPGRYTTMTLATSEFIRRFLMHVLPKGLHRIRHYGLLANGNRAANLARMRVLLGVAAPAPEPCGVGDATTLEPGLPPCPFCGGRMRIASIVQAGFMPRTDAAPPALIRIDTS
jgi:hypothetical protein